MVSQNFWPRLVVQGMKLSKQISVQMGCMVVQLAAQLEAPWAREVVKEQVQGHMPVQVQE
jgi:hypothetical protein